MADALGMSLGDIFPTAKKQKLRVAAKYVNPGDTTQTWTGRGRKPRWLEAELKEGMSLHDFLVQ